MLKSIKIRIYPDINQKQFISKQLGCCRFIYNKLLDYRTTSFKDKNISISSSQLGKYLTNLKKQKDYIFLTEVYDRCLRQTLIDLLNAYDKFYKLNKGYPK